MRQKIVAGNWKMNLTSGAGLSLVGAVVEGLLNEPKEDVLVIVAPPFPFIVDSLEITDESPVEVAAQNCHHVASGAYTGEVSAPMLASFGCGFCIVGHSERRQYFGEDDTVIGQKMQRLYEARMSPIYCCGETLEERKAGRHFEVVGKQLVTAFDAVTNTQLDSTIIAYEPVWAIGTGETATPEQAQEMHAFIRQTLRAKFGADADSVSILYGGSVKPNNAEEIFAQPDVDGGLIGGASLSAIDFLTIVNSI